MIKIKKWGVLVFCTLFLLLTLTSCKSQPDDITENNFSNSSSSPLQPRIKDNIHELDNDLLKNIAENYLTIFGFEMSFTENDYIDYERAYQYIRYGGVYRSNPFNIWARPELMRYYDNKAAIFTLPAKVVDELVSEKIIDYSELTEYNAGDGTYILDDYFWVVRPELHHYINKDTWMFTLPADTVDEYILGKFNTKLDHSQIPEYDAVNDTYTFEPFLGEFYYSLEIDEQIEIEDSMVRFICIATMHEDIQDYASSYLIDFSIQLINGEYKYLVVDIKDNDNS